MADSKLTALTGTSVPALDDLLYTVDVSDTTDDATGSSRSLLLSRLLGLAAILPGGRLTTESGVGVSTSDRTSQSTLYYTPFVSDYVRLYDGTRVREYLFTERSLSLSGLTSGKNYDVWLRDASGTLTLDLSAAWTNDTTRADALAWQSGLGWTKSGDATRLYLGTIRTTGTTTTEDSGGGSSSQVGGKRFVWNAYNRVRRHLSVVDLTDSWSYGSGTWREANGATGNRVEMVCGLAGGAVEADVMQTNIVSNAWADVSVGVDSTSSPSGVRVNTYSSSFAYVISAATYCGVFGVGYHFLQWIERAGYATPGAWFGDNGGSVQSGLRAFWEC